MLVRYVTDRMDPDSLVGAGILVVAHDLLDDDEEVDESRRARLREELAWFNANLGIPTLLSRSKKAHSANKAISWLRQSATEHIDHAKTIAAVLVRHGIGVRELKTDRPGYVVYDDEYQVVAEPFRETPR